MKKAELTEAKLALAIKCLRSIAQYGGILPSNGLAQECLDDIAKLENAARERLGAK